MSDGPSPRLERIVGAFIPPACREEVLGDLREKYVSPFQYFGLAVTVVPFVILSRIRRTSDLQLRLTEALLMYGSFLAAAWYTEPETLPNHDGLFRVTIPTAMNVIDLIFQDLWAGGSQRVRVLVFSLAMGIGIGFNTYGELAGVLLVLGLRMVTGSSRNLAHAAAPGAIRRTEFVGAKVTAKGLLILAGFVFLNVVFLAFGGRPGRPSAIAAFAVFLGLFLSRRPRKE